MSVTNEVEKTIRAYNMFRPGESVLVGLSGGADSVALLHILLGLGDMLSVKIGAAHLNHCLRGDESDRDEAFAAEIADQLGIEFYCERIDVAKFQESNRLSLETAARQVRYDFFHRVISRKGYHKIAVGHHLDDNAELILMNVLRGSGPAGLSGIPPVRDGKIVRPLISVTRGEILEFLDQKNIHYVTDSSNFEATCLRNKIRLNLLPLLKKEFNASIVDTLKRTGDILKDENSWMDQQVRIYFNGAVILKERHRIELSAAALEKAHPAVARRMVRMAIEYVKGDLIRITLGHVETLLSLITKTAGALQDLPDHIRAEKKLESIMISKQEAPLRTLGKETLCGVVEGFRYSVDCPDGRVVLKIMETGLKIQFSRVNISEVSLQSATDGRIVYMDLDLVNWPVHVRTRLNGDRFTPLGMKGTQKLKKFFINSGIPREKRSSWPVIEDMKSIIWVAGLRMGESVKIDDSTVNVLKIELLLA